MRRCILLMAAGLILNSLHAQETAKEEFRPSGKAFGKVFWNYNYNLSDDVDGRSAFAIQRAYLGYKHALSKDISVKVTLDAAKSSNASDFTAFLKAAQLDWRIAQPVKLSLGLISTKQFKTQEKFWGYRYLFKTFEDEFKHGSSADLGANAEIKLSESLKANIFVFNGEGYSNSQDNEGRMKAGGALVYKPVQALTFQGYYDIYGGKMMRNDTVIVDTTSIHSISLFAGYSNEKLRIGAGYSLQLGGTKYNVIAEDHNLTGFTIYGAYTINDKFEVFGTFMNTGSNKIDGAAKSWNANRDGNLVLAGIQYSPVKGVKTALNYRTFLYKESTISTTSFVYLNFEFAF